jgi:hypothetical protein
VESSCEFGIEPSGFMKCWGNLDQGPVKNPAASPSYSAPLQQRDIGTGPLLALGSLVKPDHTLSRTLPAVNIIS